MKKFNNKKGFTIVELVIVIAVIGILAGVLIPTFSNVTKQANETAAMEEAKNSLTAVLSASKGSIASDSKFVVDGKYVFTYKDGSLQTVSDTTSTTANGNYVMYLNDKLVTLDATNSYAASLNDGTKEAVISALNALKIAATDTNTVFTAVAVDKKCTIKVTISGDNNSSTVYNFDLLVATDVTKSTVVVIPTANTSTSAGE